MKSQPRCVTLALTGNNPPFILEIVLEDDLEFMRINPFNSVPVIVTNGLKLKCGETGTYFNSTAIKRLNETFFTFLVNPSYSLRFVP